MQRGDNRRLLSFGDLVFGGGEVLGVRLHGLAELGTAIDEGRLHGRCRRSKNERRRLGKNPKVTSALNKRTAPSPSGKNCSRQRKRKCSKNTMLRKQRDRAGRGSPCSEGRRGIE